MLQGGILDKASSVKDSHPRGPYPAFNGYIEDVLYVTAGTVIRSIGAGGFRIALPCCHKDEALTSHQDVELWIENEKPFIETRF